MNQLNFFLNHYEPYSIATYYQKYTTTCTDSWRDFLGMLCFVASCTYVSVSPFILLYAFCAVWISLLLMLCHFSAVLFS